MEFSPDEIKKYTNYIITSPRHTSPPYEWSQNIFQKYQPISGDFALGDNLYGNMECVNNKTGRMYYANPCGYWDNAKDQFDKVITKDQNLNGAMFPTGNLSNNVMVPPSNRVIFGYTRIGEEYRNR